MSPRLREILDLLRWFLLGSLVGFPVGMEMAGGGGSVLSGNVSLMIGVPVVYTLVLAGLCGLAILVMRGLKLI